MFGRHEVLDEGHVRVLTGVRARTPTCLEEHLLRDQVADLLRR